MRNITAAIALALLLGACSAQQAALVDLNVAKVQAAHDLTARTLVDSVCAMSVGAYNRLGSPADRRGVDLLCGGSGEDPITLSALRQFLETFQYLASE